MFMTGVLCTVYGAQVYFIFKKAKLKAAESVSLSNYYVWIFLCYKKLHMTKLSIRVKLKP